MASFTDLVVNGLLQFGQGQGSLNATGLRFVPPSEAQPALAANNNNLVLVEFGAQGANFFALTAAADATITGIEAVELGIEAGQRVVLFNASVHTYSCTGASGSSAVGNRFTVSFDIDAGTAVEIVYCGPTIGWAPLLPAAAA